MKSEQLQSKILGLVSLIGLMGLWGCSNDETAEPRMTTVQLISYVAGYEEAPSTNRANEVTRTWTPPTGYSLYEGSDLPIAVFFTQGTGSCEEEYFYKSNGSWHISWEEMAAASYFLYGYVPHDQSITSTVGLLTGEGKTYADGAVLTLNNVSTVSPEDICVVVGAKNGTNADTDNGVIKGQFNYEAQATSGNDKGNNYVFLLFDHLFSALRIQMRVQGDYAELRTIKLKGLHLQASTDDGLTKKKTQITVTLNKTTDGGNPISSVEFTPDPNSGDCDGAMVESTEGILLTTTYQPFQSHFMPAGVTKLTLTSTYDVYDRKGNLIRLNCEAKNTIDISQKFSGQTEALRGRRYTINLTIEPTYLYVLSDPDLDNPTVVVN